MVGENDFTAGQFQGRVEQSLLDIRGDIAEVKKEIKVIKNTVNNNRFKIAGIGATVSLIVTIGILLLRELVGK